LKRLAKLIAPGRELSPNGDRLPESLEETIAGGIAWLLSQRLTARVDAPDDPARRSVVALAS
jgi:hypothetical protein